MALNRKAPSKEIFQLLMKHRKFMYIIHILCLPIKINILESFLTFPKADIRGELNRLGVL